jgi:hypothetical protein
MLLFSHAGRSPWTLSPSGPAKENASIFGPPAARLAGPEGLHGLPSGEVREIEIHADQNGSFHTGIIFDKGSGIYRVEVFGESSWDRKSSR